MQQRLPRPANSGAQHATSQSPETNMVWPIFNKAIIQAAQRREGHNNLYRSLKSPVNQHGCVFSEFQNLLFYGLLTLMLKGFFQRFSLVPNEVDIPILETKEI